MGNIEKGFGRIGIAIMPDFLMGQISGEQEGISHLVDAPGRWEFCWLK